MLQQLKKKRGKPAREAHDICMLQKKCVFSAVFTSLYLYTVLSQSSNESLPSAGGTQRSLATFTQLTLLNNWPLVEACTLRVNHIHLARLFASFTGVLALNVIASPRNFSGASTRAQMFPLDLPAVWSSSSPVCPVVENYVQVNDIARNTSNPGGNTR